VTPRLAADREALSFAAEVARDLSRTPKRLHPKYLYDTLGSSLFDAICRLPWYRITRAETALLARHAHEVLDTVSGGTIVELGCGNGEKLEILAAALRERAGIAHVHLVDISRQALEHTRDRLEPHEFPVVLHETTYEQGLQEVLARRDHRAPMLVLFLGSNIGNYEPDETAAFLQAVRQAMRTDDAFVLGTDLTKPEGDLILAYDDPLGVTAAFNRNLLVRMNNELGADFDLAAFEHRAVWNATASRVEMHLVSTRRQQVRIPAAQLAVSFERGEYIWTESSYKYTPSQVRDLGASAGLRIADQWIDEPSRFALTRFAV
jgi:dimethylhistidine N-methyltransferase